MVAYQHFFPPVRGRSAVIRHVHRIECDDTGSATTQAADEKKRFRSEIEFPYADLETAVELAQTIHSKAGSAAAVDELAAWMGQSATGGTFRTRLGAARMFGLIDTGQGRATLTQPGRDVLDNSGKEHAARVAAFLNVQLFNALYDQFKGNLLPPPPAIERQIETLGVSPKQKERARQTFMKSATYAGFIDPTTGRFVKPGIQQKEQGTGQHQDADHGGSGGGDGSGDLELDALLIALLRKIPSPDKGWPGPNRVRWFRTFAMNVSQIYDGDGQPVEMKIELEKNEAAN
jgi:hypothetical protein